jgi:hypothetical protein
MKKLLFTGCIALFSGTYASAQTFSLEHETMIDGTIGTSTDCDNHSIAFHNRVNNTGTTPLTDLKWQIIEKTLPLGWSLYTFCDNETCLPTNQITQYETNPKTFSAIAIGDTALLKPAICVPANGDNGTGTIKVRIFNSTQSDTAVFILYRIPTGIKGIAENDQRVVLYPNPSTQKEVTVFTRKELNARQITIYNLLGQSIISTPVNLEATVVNTTALVAGTYIVQVRAADGTLIATRKLVKQ